MHRRIFLYIQGLEKKFDPIKERSILLSFLLWHTRDYITRCPYGYLPFHKDYLFYDIIYLRLNKITAIRKYSFKIN